MKTLKGICGEVLHLNYCEKIIPQETVLSFYQPSISASQWMRTAKVLLGPDYQCNFLMSNLSPLRALIFINLICD